MMVENEGLMFSSDMLAINNQNLEEAEELEDRKRREEEIHNLLTHAMGEFNYDDQSTINSSMCTNDGDSDNAPHQTHLEEAYRQADAEDQLKVLYEIRVREVKTLSDKIEKLKLEWSNEEHKLKRKIILVEQENEQKHISLKESHSLLVEKAECIRQLDTQLENAKLVIKDLEENIKELNEEKVVLRELNMKLEQQVALIENGFPLLNKTSDRELQEFQKNKIAELENSLERAAEKAEHIDRQHKKLVHELTQSMHEKEKLLVEKDSVITRLTGDVQNAQQYCQELMKNVEELKQMQKVVNGKESPLEEELRRIREYNERTDVLCENVKKAVSEEFQGQIACLNSENKILRDNFCSQEKELKEAQQQLHMLTTIENDRQILQAKLKELEGRLNEANINADMLGQELLQCKKHKDLLEESNKQLNIDKETLVILKTENKNLQKQIQDLQHYISETASNPTAEKCMQVSFSSISSTEIANLRKEKEDVHNELISAQTNINSLQNKIQQVLEENSQIKVKIALEQEREALIKKLQAKAAEFENIIFEKQRNLSKPKMVAMGTNTENCQEDGSLLKVKYDTLLYQTEAALRKNLKREFENKLEKLVSEFNSKLKSSSCIECRNLKEEKENISELRDQDRQAVAKLVGIWEQKFIEMEKEAENRIAALVNFKEMHNEELISNVRKLEQEYKRELKKLEQKTTVELKQQDAKFQRIGHIHHTTLTKRIQRIKEKLQQGNDEISSIERQFLKKRATLDKNNLPVDEVKL